MPGRSLRIAWLGPGPSDDGGVGGALSDMLAGLVARGHQIDCFLPGRPRPLPERVADLDGLTFVWGNLAWQWDRWYSRTRVGAFATGLVARAATALRMRRELASRHGAEPYDLIYQFSTIESLAVPRRLLRVIPLVIHPETHVAGELRFLIAERRLARRGQPLHMFAAVVAILSVRALVQRARIRRARLLICISSVFRQHLVRDYGFPVDRTVVIPNPVRLERFPVRERPPGRPATVLVLGRVAVRKGVQDVVALARLLLERGSAARLRIVGGPSLWSDYTVLLEGLAGNAEYAGPIAAAEVPAELERSDVLLQPSRYEPFALTVAEALACGVPVVATSEVGAIEGVERAVAAEVAPGDVAAMADAIEAMLARLERETAAVRALARAEAERLFAPERVCAQISEALEALVAGAGGRERAASERAGGSRATAAPRATPSPPR
jgi:glycosyltransferase involved in cell wall biosynthesis